MDNTIVSLTGLNDKTANADIKGGRMPSDEELVSLAKKHKLQGVIKATITNVIGDKVRFQFVIKGDKMQKLSTANKTNAGLERLMGNVLNEEIGRITSYKKYNISIPAFMQSYGLDEREVQKRVDTYRRTGLGSLVPEQYADDVYTYMMLEVAAEKYRDGIVQA